LTTFWATRSVADLRPRDDEVRGALGARRLLRGAALPERQSKSSASFFHPKSSGSSFAALSSIFFCRISCALSRLIGVEYFAASGEAAITR
jgi:hypothetical protein